MKRFLALFLIIVMVLAICGCAENKPTSNDDKKQEQVKYAEKIYADARTYATVGGVAKRDLSNTVYKLQNDKKLNILYYGGSVTVGTGSSGEGKSWASITEQWFRDTYKEAQINVTNSAIGGTSTYWGLFRAERDLLPYKPDLIFVEFAVNDSYGGLYYAQSVYLMETLIKTINTQLPEADIVLVLTTDKGKLGQEFEEKSAHRAVAAHYGIPCIDAGEALAEEIEKTGKQWSDYAIDYSHPNNDGYKVYGNAVVAGLKKLLPSRSAGLTKHTIPEKTYVESGINMEYKTLTADEIEHNDKWELGSRRTNGYTKILRPIEKGATLTFEFEGVSFGILAQAERVSNVKVTIDGEEIKYVTNPDTEGTVEKLIYDNLAEGVHKVTLEYHGTGRFYLCAIFIG